MQEGKAIVETLPKPNYISHCLKGIINPGWLIVEYNNNLVELVGIPGSD